MRTRSATDNASHGVPTAGRPRRRLLIPICGLVMLLASSVGLILLATRPGDGAPLYTSPGTGITVTPAVLVAAGAMTQSGATTYALTSSLLIQSADSLSFPPGTTILPAADVSIAVHGRMDASGTEASPIRFGETTGNVWNGIRLNVSTRACSMIWVEIAKAQGTALEIVFTDTAPGCDLSHLTITDVTGTAVSLTDVPAAAGLVLQSIAVRGAGTGVRLESAQGVSLETVSVTALNTTSGRRAGIWIEKGSAGLAVQDGVFEGPGLFAGNNGASRPDADSLLVRRCTFSGTSTETAVELEGAVGARFERVTVTGYGVGLAARDCPGLTISQLEAWNCGTAARIAGAPRFAVADRTPTSGWLEIAQDRSTWNTSEDGNELVRLLPYFQLPTPSILVDSIGVYADGYARFHASAAEYAAISGAAPTGKAQILSTFATPVLFALPDDLEPSSDTLALEGFGFRPFAPGDTDRDGIAAAETVAVLSWRAPTVEDDPSRATGASIQLYPDGRIRWLYRELRTFHFENSFFAGAYLDSGRTVISAVVNPVDTSTMYTYTPGVTAVSGSSLESSTIAGSTVGIAVDSAIRFAIRSSTLSENGTAIAVGPGLDSFFVTSSNIVQSATADIAVSATSGTISLDGVYMPAANVTGNTPLVTITSPLAAPLLTGPAAAGVSNDPKACLLTRTLRPERAGILSWARAVREFLIDSRIGRLLVALYQAL